MLLQKVNGHGNTDKNYSYLLDSYCVPDVLLRTTNADSLICVMPYEIGVIISIL